MAGCEAASHATPPADSGPLVRGESPEFSRQAAWRHVEKLAAYAPRESGSRGNRKARKYLSRQLDRLGAQVSELPAEVVPGPGEDATEVVHLKAVLPGQSPDVLMLAAHYDSPVREGSDGVAASDGASGVAVVLELARVLATRERPYTVWVYLVDGDGLTPGRNGEGRSHYLGSRALAESLQESGELSRVRVAVFFDQVCDPELRVSRDLRSHPMHRDVFWAAAFDLGAVEAFGEPAAFESPRGGHLEFLELGMRRVVAITDDGFGDDEASGQHGESDADDGLQRCSADSVTTVGTVAAESLARIAARLRKIDGFANGDAASSQPTVAESQGDRDAGEAPAPGAPDPAHRATSPSD